MGYTFPKRLFPVAKCLELLILLDWDNACLIKYFKYVHTDVDAIYVYVDYICIFIHVFAFL